MSAVIDYKTLPVSTLRLIVRVLNKCRSIDASLPVVMTGAQISVLKGEEALAIINDAIAAKTATPEKVADIAQWAKNAEESPRAAKGSGKRPYGRKPGAEGEAEAEYTEGAPGAAPASAEAGAEAVKVPTELPADHPEVEAYEKEKTVLSLAEKDLAEASKRVADLSAEMASLAGDPSAMLAKAADLQAAQKDQTERLLKVKEARKGIEVIEGRIKAALAELVKAAAEEAAYAKAATATVISCGMSGYKPPKKLMEEVQISMDLGKHILLVGPAGTGKSSLVKALTKGQNLIRLNLNGQTGPDDLIGHYLAKDGETVWVEGALPRAMKEGLPLLLDELDFCVPEVLSLLHPVLESEGVLVLKEHDGEVITPAPGFRVFGTANSLGIHDDAGLYTGTQAMNHAFVSRWAGFFVDYPTEKEEVAALISHGIPKPIAEATAKVATSVRELIKSKTLNGAWGVRHSLDFAMYAMKLRGDTKRAFDMASRLKFSRTEVAGAWEVIQRVVGAKIAVI